jgi:hypothetical protein
MNQKEEVLVEEVLIAYLRSSKDVKIEKVNIEENDKVKKLTISFDVNKDFGVAFITSLDNQFSAFFNKNNEHSTDKIKKV